MDNEIIILLNNTIPTVAMSPLAIKLMQSVCNAIRILYEPRLRYRNGKAEIEIKKYERENLPSASVLPLSNRDFYDIKNYLSVVKYAFGDLNDIVDGEEVNEEQISLNWMLRFFDAVRYIDDEDLRALWSRIMGGEIRNPGACSFRTITILMDLNQSEAKDFYNLCKYVLVLEDTFFIFEDGFQDERRNKDGEVLNRESGKIIYDAELNYEKNVCGLIEAGLISYSEQLYIDFETDSLMIIHNKAVRFAIKGEEKQSFFIQPLILTKCGREIYRSIIQDKNYKADKAYAIACMEEMSCSYGISVKVFE